MAYNPETYKRYYEKNKEKCANRNAAHYQKEEVKKQKNEQMKEKYHSSEEERERQRKYKRDWSRANREHIEVKRKKRLEDDTAFWKSKFAGMRNRCEKNNIPIYDSFEEFMEDISPLPTHCEVLGVELIYRGNYRQDNYATIDKKIPELGYTKGNVCIISNRANRLKQDNTIETLELILSYLKTTINTL